MCLRIRNKYFTMVAALIPDRISILALDCEAIVYNRLRFWESQGKNDANAALFCLLCPC